MKDFLVLICIISTFFIVSCGEDNIEVPVDSSVQRGIDIGLINDYLNSNGFSSSVNDTTELGVRYIILDDAGRSETISCDSGCIDESDNVKYRYTGMLLDETIFDTTVKSVGDSLNEYYKNNPVLFNGDTVVVFPDSKEYLISELTFSSSGWSVSGFITGFKDGIVNTFDKLNAGGSVRILIPSDLGYGASTPSILIPRNSVLIFDLYPISVTKQ